jgi:hypothetical protein
MTSALARTFLVRKQCITSVQSVADPIFEQPIHI